MPTNLFAYGDCGFVLASVLIRSAKARFCSRIGSPVDMAFSLSVIFRYPTMKHEKSPTRTRVNFVPHHSRKRPARGSHRRAGGRGGLCRRAGGDGVALAARLAGSVRV